MYSRHVGFVVIICSAAHEARKLIAWQVAAAAPRAGIRPYALGLVRRTAVAHVFSMKSNALLSQVLQLPPEQRLQLVEDIWDSLARSETSVPVPEWHRAELDRRLADPGEQETLSWSEVQKRLKPRR